jgi:site-specific DNA-methyltransferase (adenine-specific)
MEGMAGMEDNQFDLAIVDPPFGIGENWKKDRHSKFRHHSSSYRNDSIPDSSYFDLLFRVSKDQIIWGCNYYWNYLRPSNNLIFWDKGRDPFVTFNSAGELAWTSKKHVAFSKASFRWNGAVNCEKRSGFHPHEKPIGLYKWLLKNYADHSDRILDTYGGSMSLAIACYDMGFDLVCYELDKDYYKAAVERFENHIKQEQLFEPSDFHTNNNQKTLYK